jgi:tetratricopeptide (TPR) repeat protein
MLVNLEKLQKNTQRIIKVKKMKTYRLAWTVFAFLIFGIVSCTANLEVRKKQAEASRNLGEAYYLEGNYPAALGEFLKSETLYPGDPYLQNDLGLTYMAMKKMDLAIKHFKKALEIKPDYAPALNSLGTAYLNKKEWDTAIRYFKEVTENLLYATPHFPLSNLGWAYYNKKEYALAEKFYLKALEINPKFINALAGLGKTYIEMGRSSEAVATLEKAVKDYPRLGQLYLELARAYTLSGEYKKALDAYEKVVEFAPGSALAREAETEAQKIRKFR